MAENKKPYSCYANTEDTSGCPSTPGQGVLQSALASSWWSEGSCSPFPQSHQLSVLTAVLPNCIFSQLSAKPVFLNRSFWPIYPLVPKSMWRDFIFTSPCRLFYSLIHKPEKSSLKYMSKSRSTRAKGIEWNSNLRAEVQQRITTQCCKIKRKIVSKITHTHTPSNDGKDNKGLEILWGLSQEKSFNVNMYQRRSFMGCCQDQTW